MKRWESLIRELSQTAHVQTQGDHSVAFTESENICQGITLNLPRTPLVR